jgi:hypothetical protein
MANCFENIVGVKGCTDTTSTSGLYINGVEGIEGISLKTASNSADSETISGQQLLKGCINKATTEIQFLASEELSRYFQFNSVINSYKFFNNGTAQTNPTDVVLYLNDYYSLYSSYYIDTISILSTDTQTAILDINGITYNVDLEANVSKDVLINTEFYETLTISILGTNIMTDTAFFRGIIQYRCSEEKFWCTYKRDLALSIKYLAGAMFFAEVLNSDRYNLTTSNDREMASSNYSRCEKTAKNYLKTSINKIKNSIANETCPCLRCTDIDYTYIKP